MSSPGLRQLDRVLTRHVAFPLRGSLEAALDQVLLAVCGYASAHLLLLVSRGCTDCPLFALAEKADMTALLPLVVTPDNGD